MCCKYWNLTGMALIGLMLIAGCGNGKETPSEERMPWNWQKPGLGVMYQIEYRPGWDWDRDYTVFNQSLMDGEGNLDFNGPYPRVDEWVGLSRDIGLDYHIMEIKWHDGICYFHTELTDWKTDTDYAEPFAELSRKAGIPFLYYYSAIFDHNPQFDDIQPDPHQTFSAILEEPQPVYENYLRGQYREIMEQYGPDGMWVDWYWTDGATPLTIDFFQENYPEAVLTFNASNYNPLAHGQLSYTSGEAHGLEGPPTKIVDFGDRTITVFESAWYWANANRRDFTHPWELVGPAGKWWQDPSPRDDQYEILRIVAVVLANGGKYAIGATSKMDGSIYPGQVGQLRTLGNWYRPRRNLFTEATPLQYQGECPEGVTVNQSRFYAVASSIDNDRLLHLLNFDGQEVSVTIQLAPDSWGMVNGAYLEPSHRELAVIKSGEDLEISLDPGDVDPVDTIIRLTGSFQ